MDRKSVFIFALCILTGLGAWGSFVPETATIATVTLQQWLQLAGILGPILGTAFGVSTRKDLQ